MAGFTFVNIDGLARNSSLGFHTHNNNNLHCRSYSGNTDEYNQTNHDWHCHLVSNNQQHGTIATGRTDFWCVVFNPGAVFYHLAPAAQIYLTDLVKKTIHAGADPDPHCA